MFGEIAPKLRGNQPPQTFGSASNQSLASDVSIAVGSYTTLLALTLPPGTYELKAFTTVVGSVSVGICVIRLFDSTAGTSLAVGVASNQAQNDTSVALCCPLVLTATHTIVLQAQTSAGTWVAKALDPSLSNANATKFYAIQITGGVMQLPPTIASAPAFVSLPQTPAASTLYSVTHNLGRVPNRCMAYLKCITPELGYSAGDEVDVSCINIASANQFNGSIAWNATSIYYNSGLSNGGFAISYRSTGGSQGAITPANWQLFLVAW